MTVGIDVGATEVCWLQCDGEIVGSDVGCIVWHFSGLLLGKDEGYSNSFEGVGDFEINGKKEFVTCTGVLIGDSVTSDGADVGIADGSDVGR